jgi:hypothetical protein
MMTASRLVLIGVLCCLIGSAYAQELFDLPAPGVETRWFSFENRQGERGMGGMVNQGRKGSPATTVKAGETFTMVDLAGPGVIRRIWLTVRGDLSNLRGLVIRAYWDQSSLPSIEAPLQDFFGIPLGRQVAFESAFFSNPEERSFNCFIPMPFRKQARVTVENQSPKDCDLLFYEVDCTVGDRLPDELTYLHARYRRQNPTTPKSDFEILPKVTGKGRFLGCNVGIRPVEPYGEPFWFGEGEMKIYVDGDQAYPTLVGTGTEDLVGSAWGLGKFNHLYQGCLLSQKDDGVWGFYRYHVPDPVYFHKSVRVTLQQIAGGTAGQLSKLRPEQYPELVADHRKFDPAASAAADAGSWHNFEAPQDVSCTAYWYQTLPAPKFPPLEPYAERVKDLASLKK